MEPSSARLGTRYAGRYDLLGLLGEGGMGAVYRARHVFTGADVALKIMHSSVARSPNARDRFLREAQAPSAIGHPGIVSVTDAGVADDGTLYLALELLEGENLGEAVERGSVDGASLIAYSIEFLDALGAAHGSGIVHRDIKHDNNFLNRAESGERQVRLLDFGITHHVDESVDKLTQTGTILGTPHFMSPEQASGGVIDARSDLYSVGGTMFYALTGRAPFEEQNYNLLIVAIMTREAPSVRVVRPEVPEDLARVVDRALSSKAEERFSSAEEMRAALAACGPTDLGAIAATEMGIAPTAASQPGEAPVAMAYAPTRASASNQVFPPTRPAVGATTRPQPTKTPVAVMSERAVETAPMPEVSAAGAAPRGGPRTGLIALVVVVVGLVGGAAVVAGLRLFPAGVTPAVQVDAGSTLRPVVSVPDVPVAHDATDAGPAAAAAEGGEGTEPGSQTAALAARLAELEEQNAERERAEAEAAAARSRAQKRAQKQREVRREREAQAKALANSRCSHECFRTSNTCRRAAGADRQAMSLCTRELMSCRRNCSR
ncbi:MAG: protein kinase [Deltaproteobacteria bacterium]|nr:protein kinase [Deltaproteobacteria bacterium]